MILFDNEETELYRQKSSLLLEKVEGIETINISSVDGFEIVSMMKNQMDFSQNLSAISSSILALINTLLQEFKFHKSDLLEINSTDGVILIAPLALAEMDLIVLIQTNSQTLQGELLYYVKAFLEDLRVISEH